MLSGEGAGGKIGFIDGLKMIAAEKRALGGFSNMKRFISACFCDGGTIETRMRKEKRKFLRVEMLIVRKEYQGQGYMRQMMEYAYRIAESHQVPVILDTDDKDKAARYEHLGMKLERVRNCGEQFHMYDLIRYLCEVDFITYDLMGADLRRTQTLANGGSCCDFHVSKKEKKE